MLISLFMLIPKTILKITSMLYLSLFLGIKVKGICDVHAFSIEGGRIRRQIFGGKGSEIHKGVKVRTRLILEENVTIGEGCRIEGGEPGDSVFIGRGTVVHRGAWILGKVRIGRYSTIGTSNILARDHDKNYAGLQVMFYRRTLAAELPLIDKGGIEIGNDVGIAHGAIILLGVHIGDGAVVAAGSVIHRDVPPYSIAAGNPARHAMYRFSPEKIEKLLKLRWWDWPVDKMKRNIKFFTTDLNYVEDIDSLVVD